MLSPENRSNLTEYISSLESGLWEMSSPLAWLSLFLSHVSLQSVGSHEEAASWCLHYPATSMTNKISPWIKYPAPSILHQHEMCKKHSQTAATRLFFLCGCFCEYLGKHSMSYWDMWLMFPCSIFILISVFFQMQLKNFGGQAWWYMSLISTLGGRGKQISKFKAGSVYRESS